MSTQELQVLIDRPLWSQHAQTQSNSNGYYQHSKQLCFFRQQIPWMHLLVLFFCCRFSCRQTLTSFFSGSNPTLSLRLLVLSLTRGFIMIFSGVFGFLLCFLLLAHCWRLWQSDPEHLPFKLSADSIDITVLRQLKFLLEPN